MQTLTIRHCKTAQLTAPRQRLIHTNPRSDASAISTAQDYHPNFWSNSSSGIGSASKPASCNNRSCPASALRFAVWSNSSTGIASNTASGAASSCPIFISSGGERAGPIAGALVGSPTCSSICRTVAGSVTELHGKYRAWSGRVDLATVEEGEFGILRCLWGEDLPTIFEFGTRNRNATPRRVGVATLEAVP